MSDKTVEFLVESGENIKELPKTVTDEMPGRYEAEEEIARGGSGRILAVLDRHIGRRIAMKELLSDLNKDHSKDDDDPQETAIRNRFLREARVTGRLEHPSIVPVYEIGRHADGSFYYTMRLVKGTTMQSAIRKCNNVFQRLELLPHFLNVCNAVAYAHSKGVINRDLKPSNVMIGEFGETVVLDWGLAKIKDSEEPIFVRQISDGVGKTVIGQAIGTPSYMPPEQAEGKIGDIDEISDIYSLGAILYQILTGKPPVSGKSLDEIIQKVLNEKIENAVKKEKDAPPELAAIAEKALSKNKDARYVSVADMIDDLSAYMSGRKVGVYHYSIFGSIKFAATRHKTAFISALVVIAIGIFAAVQILLALNRTTIAKQEAEQGKVTANYRTAQAFSEKSDRLGTEKDYIASRVYAAAAMYYNPLNKKSPEYNAEFAATSGDSEEILSSAASKFYIENFHRGAAFERDVSTHCKITAAALSHAENTVATGCDDGKVILFNFPALSEIYKFNLESRVSEIGFSEDDKKLLVATADRGIFNIDIQAKTAENRSGRSFSGNDSELESIAEQWYQKENEKIESFAVSPDKKTILAGSESGKIAVFSREKKDFVNVLSFWTSPIVKISFQSDGSHFITVSKEGKIMLWDAEKMMALFVIDGHDSAVSAAFLAGSERIVSAGEDGLLRIWKRRNKKGVQSFDIAFNDIRKAALTKGFAEIFALSGDKLSIVSKNNEFLFEHEENFIVSDADISEDGKYIAVAAETGKARVYNRESGDKKDYDANCAVSALRISPDSKHIAFLCSDEIRLVSLESPDTQSFKCSHKGKYGAAFSRDSSKFSAICGGAVAILSVPDFSLSGEVKIEGRNAISLEFLPDSTILAGFSKGILSHIDTSDNSIMDFRGKFDPKENIAVSSDGAFAATLATHNGVKIWNVREHKLLLTIATDKDPGCLTFAPDRNSVGICIGGTVRFYPLDAPDLELAPAELLRKMEFEAGMELKGFYLETLTSEDISQRK